MIRPVIRPVTSVAGFLAAHRAGDPVLLGGSGTSGAPRPVIRTTSSWTDSFADVAALSGLTPVSRVWVPGPLTATMNLFAAVHATLLGARVVPDLDSATHAQLTPAGLHRLLDDGAPLAGVTVVVAGDRLSPELAGRAEAAGARVHHYYGAAELSFVAWGAHAEDLRPFPGVDVEVRSGAVWVRTPYACLGPDGPDDPDGPGGPLLRDGEWATVGDRGRLEEGRLVVTGRPEAATVGGATVVLADVEAVLVPLAAGEVCVVAVPHDRLGSVLAVALTDASDHAALLAAARTRLHGAARPRHWWLLDRLPETAAGKRDRGAVVSLLTEGEAAARRLV